jgi:hypothetical protein
MRIYIVVMTVISLGQIIAGIRTIRSQSFTLFSQEGIPLFESTKAIRLDRRAAIFFGRCLFASGTSIFVLWMLNTAFTIVSPELMFLAGILITVLVGIFGHSKATATQQAQTNN